MTPQDRKKRIAFLKRLIIRTVFTVILLLAAGCVILGICVIKYHRKVAYLEETVAKLSESLEQRELYQNQMKTSDGSLDGSAGSMADGNEASDGAVYEEVDEAEYIRLWEEKQAAMKPRQEPVSGIRKVYLTFDDGPSPCTDQILDILDQYGVKATFFVTGQGKEAQAERLKRIVEKGHSIGMHTYSHKYAEIYKSKEAFIKDFNEISDYIYKYTGVHSTIYRFPGGSSNHVGNVPVADLVSYLDELGVQYYDWNVSGQDATGKNLSAEQIANNCTRDLKNYSTAIILLHDGGDKKNTVKALPQIIENILAMEDTVILPIDDTTYPIHH